MNPVNVYLAALCSIMISVSEQYSVLPLYRWGSPKVDCGLLTDCQLQCTDYAVDERGCQICQCRKDLCQDTVCGDGKRCVVFKIRNVPFGAMCVQDPKTTTTATTTGTNSATTTPSPSICPDGRSAGKPCDAFNTCPSAQKCKMFESKSSGFCCRDTVEQRENDFWKPVCQRGLVIGPCRALVHRHFFNITSMKCEEYIYGGCKEGENSFPTVEDCQKTCGNPCSLPPSPGRCRAAIVRFFFNSVTNQCEEFTYGGCEGNGNNWLSRDQCQQFCGNRRPNKK